ncbi:MAG TPA: hypothetical protein ENI62_01570 [Gammaproteobacteria bacterium]|nr:hypothetical protein [Gammaproteobacteria bacterium]
MDSSASGACLTAERVFFARSGPDVPARPPHDPPLVVLAGRSIQSIQFSLAQPFPRVRAHDLTDRVLVGLFTQDVTGHPGAPHPNNADRQ